MTCKTCSFTYIGESKRSWKSRGFEHKHGTNGNVQSGSFIYTWAIMNFFRHFTVKKTMLPLLAERLSCLYMQWFAFKCAICEEGLWKNCVGVSKFLLYRGEIKGSETFLMLILSEKRLILHENNTLAFHFLVTLECCCLPGKLQQQGKFVASFVYKIDKIPAIFSNLRDWRAAKTGACLLRFSALKWECRLRGKQHAEPTGQDIHPNYASILETGVKTKSKRLFLEFISGQELC